MKKLLCNILFIAFFSVLPMYGGVSMLDGTIYMFGKAFVIHDGVRSTEKYIYIGKTLRMPPDYFLSLDPQEIYVYNDSTLVFGKYRYHLTKQDKIVEREPERKEDPGPVIEEPINTDEIVKINGWVSVNKTKCTLIKNGQEYPLKGRVKIVDSFEDIKVKVVDSWEDLDIHIDNYSSSCCCFTVADDYFYDVKVKIVDSFEDIKVRLVDNTFHSVSIP